MIMVIYYQIQLENAFVMKVKDLLEILKRKDANVEKILGIFNLTLISNRNLIFQENVSVVTQYSKDAIGVKTLNHSQLVL